MAIVVIEERELEALLERVIAKALGQTRRPELLDADEVARVLKIQRSTVPTLVRREGLPHTRVGRAYRFNLPDVLAWCEERMVKKGSHSRKHGAVVRELADFRKR